MLVSAAAFAMASGAKESSSTGSSAAPVTLKVAAWGILEKGTEPYFKSLQAKFEKTHPKIKVKWVGYPYGQIRQQVLIMANAGDAPDVVQTARPWLDGFIASGYFASLNTLLPASYQKDIYSNIRADLTENGKLWAAPWIYSPFVLFYNKALFREAGIDPSNPPTTYEQAMVDAAKLSKLTDSSGNHVYGFGITTASVPVSGDNLLSVMRSFGGGIFSGNKVNADRPQNVEALRYLEQLSQKKYNPNGAKLKDLRNLFAIGRLGMYLDQLWGLSGVYSINPKIKDVVGVADPLGTSSSRGESDLEAHLLMITKQSKLKAQAVKFIEFATSAKRYAAYEKVNPFLVPRRSIAAMPAFTDNTFISGILKGAPKAIRPLPKNSNMENAFLELSSAAQSVTVGGTAPSAAVKQMQTKLEQILK